MPAKNLRRIDEDGIYLHIYNKGVEKRAIFNDEEDYQVFLDYLKDYLTTPKERASIKKAFEVNGRTFQGVPHQPKNYFNQIELVAYSLRPDHFHLILRQVTKGSVENFLRSLCTRYSIYFNKKNQHSGTLFTGPYKSVVIDEVRLPHLTRHLHRNTEYSSYPEYLGKTNTAWIKPEAVLDLFDKDIAVSGSSYKDFVEKGEEQKGLLDDIIIEKELEHLERIDPTEEKPLGAKIVDESVTPQVKTRSSLPDFLAISSAVFLLLVTFGLGNIKLTEARNSQHLPNTAVLGKTIEETPPKETIEATPDPTPETSPEATSSATPETEPEATSSAIPEATSSAKPEGTSQAELEATPTAKLVDAVVKVEGSSSVNIHQQEDINSKKVGQAKNGDTFELVSINSNWFGIRLDDGSTGFISARYMEMREIDTNE